MNHGLNIQALLFLIITILLLLVAAKEEMQRCTLNLDNRVKTPQCNDRYALRVVPYALPPEFLRQNNRPHSLFPIRRCAPAMA